MTAVLPVPFEVSASFSSFIMMRQCRLPLKRQKMPKRFISGRFKHQKRRKRPFPVIVRTENALIRPPAIEKRGTIPGPIGRNEIARRAGTVRYSTPVHMATRRTGTWWPMRRPKSGSQVICLKHWHEGGESEDQRRARDCSGEFCPRLSQCADAAHSPACGDTTPTIRR